MSLPLDNPNPPAKEEMLWEENGIASVDKKLDDSWRHGNYVTEVFYRESDKTYWEASYRVSGDGETHELREGLHTVRRVYPREVIEKKTVFDHKPAEASAEEPLILVHFLQDCGRMGAIECFFATTTRELEFAKDKEICLGEVLGKHSEVVVEITDENITIVSTDQEKIKWLMALEGKDSYGRVTPLLPVGFDLIGTLKEQMAEESYPDDEEDE